MPEYTFPVQGSAYRFPLTLYKGAVKITNPTIAAGDFIVSTNFGAFDNLDTLPVVTPAGSAQIQVDVSVAEMTAATTVTIIAEDQAGAEWDPQTITLLPTNTPLTDLVDDVWDEVLTAATHNILRSAGRRLRQIASTLIYDGTVVSATTNTVVLDAGASTQNNVYRGCIVVLMDSLGAGQPRMIVEYIGGTRTAIIDHPWVIIPILADELILLAASQEIVTAFGTMVSATANTMRLAADASAVNNIYRYSNIVVTSATGAGSEARLITSYDGATQTVTVSPDWTVTPLAGAVYKIMPIGRAVTESMSDNAITAASLSTLAVAKIAAGVWDALCTAMTTVGSIGRALMAFLVGRYKFDKVTYVETISDPAGVAVTTRTVTDTAAEVNKQ